MTETVGVDIGGTKVSVARLSGDTLSEPHVEPTVRSGPEQLLEQIIAAVEQVCEPGTAAVGIGVPSVVDFSSGRLRSSVNVPLRDVPLRELLAERLDLPVYVDNDATVAALAEACERGRIVVPNLVMFTVGTGVGGGLVLGGRLFRGATGAAGEVGHTLVGLDLARGAPEATGFPQPGSLEAFAAGSRLDELAAAAAERNPESELALRAIGGAEIGGRDVVECAQAGDAAALAALRELGECLGVGIANAINLLDPDVIAIGGGVSAAGELLLGPARQTALEYVLDGVGTATEIRLSRHGPEAGVLGAALLAATEGST